MAPQASPQGGERFDARVRALGRALLFAHLMLSPLAFLPATVEAFEYPKVMLLIATAVLLLGGALASWMRRAALGGALSTPFAALREPVALGFALYLCSAAASTAVSISPLTSLFGAHESFSGLTTAGAYVVLFFASRGLCTQPGEWAWLLRANVAGATGAALYGLVQWLGRDPVRWTRTHEFLGVTRAFGTMGNPNFLGSLLAMSLPVVGFFALRSLRAGRRPAALALGALGLVQVVALLATVSRGAYVSLAAVALVFAGGWLCAAQSRQARLRLAAGTLAVVLAGAAAVLALPRLRGAAQAMARRVALTLEARPQERPVGGVSFKEEPRLFLWPAALRMFRERPLLGVGLDGFQLAYQKYRSLEIWAVEGHRTPAKAHNEALQVLATQGLLGAAALVLIVGGLVSSLWRAVRRHPDERGLFVAAGASLVGFVVPNLFTFTVAGFGTLFVTLAAMVSRLGAGPPAPGGPAPAASPLRLRAARVALALAAASTLAALWVAVIVPVRADLAEQRGIALAGGPPATPLQPLSEATRLQPRNDLYWSRLGVAHFKLAGLLRGVPERRGQLEGARAAFTRAAELVPANSYHHASVARALGEMTREKPPLVPREQVYAAFEAAQQRDPRNPYWYFEAGRVALDLDDRASVETWSRKGLDVWPRYGPAAWLLASLTLQDALPLLQSDDLAARAGAFSSAGEQLRDAARKSWYGEDGLRAVSGSQAAAAFVVAGRLAEAREMAEFATSVDPNYADGRYNLGKVCERMGDLDRAAFEYRQALRLRPEHAEAQRALQALEAARGRPGA